MTMTRKDFISIAQAIKEATIHNYSAPIMKINPTIDKNELINSMCIILKANNNRFDSARFISACNDSSE